jgi:hypothetical protein
LADDAIEQAVKIKFLRRELSIAMPRSASAMQFLPAKKFLHGRNLVAVKQTFHPLPRLGAHKQFWVGPNIAYFISDVKKTGHIIQQNTV